MKRINFKRLLSAKQLKDVSCEKVISAGFEDEEEKWFCITFQLDDGRKKDLAIIFDREKMEVCVSEKYQ